MRYDPDMLAGVDSQYNDCVMSNLMTYSMSPNILSKFVDGGKELTKGVVSLSPIFVPVNVFAPWRLRDCLRKIQ